MTPSGKKRPSPVTYVGSSPLKRRSPPPQILGSSPLKKRVVFSDDLESPSQPMSSPGSILKNRLVYTSPSKGAKLLFLPGVEKTPKTDPMALEFWQKGEIHSLANKQNISEFKRLINGAFEMLTINADVKFEVYATFNNILPQLTATNNSDLLDKKWQLVIEKYPMIETLCFQDLCVIQERLLATNDAFAVRTYIQIIKFFNLLVGNYKVMSSVKLDMLKKVFNMALTIISQPVSKSIITANLQLVKEEKLGPKHMSTEQSQMILDALLSMNTYQSGSLMTDKILTIKLLISKYPSMMLKNFNKWFKVLLGLLVERNKAVHVIATLLNAAREYMNSLVIEASLSDIWNEYDIAAEVMHWASLKDYKLAMDLWMAMTLLRYKEQIPREWLDLLVKCYGMGDNARQQVLKAWKAVVYIVALPLSMIEPLNWQIDQQDLQVWNTLALNVLYVAQITPTVWDTVLLPIFRKVFFLNPSDGMAVRVLVRLLTGKPVKFNRLKVLSLTGVSVNELRPIPPTNFSVLYPRIADLVFECMSHHDTKLNFTLLHALILAFDDQSSKCIINCVNYLVGNFNGNPNLLDEEINKLLQTMKDNDDVKIGVTQAYLLKYPQGGKHLTALLKNISKSARRPYKMYETLAKLNSKPVHEFLGNFIGTSYLKNDDYLHLLNTVKLLPDKKLLSNFYQLPTTVDLVKELNVSAWPLDDFLFFSSKYPKTPTSLFLERFKEGPCQVLEHCLQYNHSAAKNLFELPDWFTSFTSQEMVYMLDNYKVETDLLPMWKFFLTNESKDRIFALRYLLDTGDVSILENCTSEAVSVVFEEKERSFLNQLVDLLPSPSMLWKACLPYEDHEMYASVTDYLTKHPKFDSLSDSEDCTAPSPLVTPKVKKSVSVSPHVVDKIINRDLSEELLQVPATQVIDQDVTIIYSSTDVASSASKQRDEEQHPKGDSTFEQVESSETSNLVTPAQFAARHIKREKSVSPHREGSATPLKEVVIPPSLEDELEPSRLTPFEDNDRVSPRKCLRKRVLPTDISSIPIFNSSKRRLDMDTSFSSETSSVSKVDKLRKLLKSITAEDFEDEDCSDIEISMLKLLMDIRRK